ncbi:MAG TPA: ABC transporter permease subunit, partial [Gemmatimonadales bacterium]|nr:ABC transporter permease subunit [Gemmatimonadales bacterium]
ETVSFLVVLPIALPGVVTGVALSNTFATLGIPFGLFTIIVGHATFCVVIAYNNVLARLRRTTRTLEEASMDLGADTWQTFRRITLPNIKWGLLYGVVLCNARAMGEFGAVSVVSGHIRGLTDTLPLHVEILYNEYEYAAAFAVASLLALLALATLAVKSWLEWRLGRD